jgi:phosphatidylethanolamine/phosphatidyl-N-methylethanolamine N-methyltransferase
MGLRESYSLLSPLYDPLVAPATRSIRRRSLATLGQMQDQRILITGIGTGLDIPYLPPGAHYTGVDITPAMLERARYRARAHDRNVELQVADAMALPFADESFDQVIMHLILAVVPRPGDALHEARRVVRRGGRLVVLDKFLRINQKAPVRRVISPLIAAIATRTDIVFEQLLTDCKGLRIVSDEPAMVRGWFRRIELRREP